MKTTGYAAYAPDKPLAPYDFERRELRSNDVAIEILYSGVCHSDLHTARGDWGPTPLRSFRAMKSSARSLRSARTSNNTPWATMWRRLHGG